MRCLHLPGQIALDLTDTDFEGSLSLGLHAPRRCNIHLQLHLVLTLVIPRIVENRGHILNFPPIRSGCGPRTIPRQLV